MKVVRLWLILFFESLFFYFWFIRCQKNESTITKREETKAKKNAAIVYAIKHYEQISTKFQQKIFLLY